MSDETFLPQATPSCVYDISMDHISAATPMIERKTKSTAEFDIYPEKSVISFHGITYEVEEKLSDVPWCGEKVRKEILKNVSGILTPGLNSIMGPTGSGKTSLLDILAKRKDPRGLKSGTVLHDGEKPSTKFRLKCGYVVQDDVVMGMLSVRENLAFSANLRLSNEQYDAKQRAAKVSEVIQQLLGLQDCADTKVGSEFIRGVSGGERKRCNIGMELVLDPPIIFLDEPTTGLDANTANSIILLLHKLSRDGRNIILSIHQPRFSIFSLFDSMLLLQHGNIVYKGKASEAVSYFSSIGYPCPRFHNPADFFLDIVGGDVETAQLLGRMCSQTSSSESLDEENCILPVSSGTCERDVLLSVDNEEVNDNEKNIKLLRCFHETSIYKEESQLLAKILSKYVSNGSHPNSSLIEVSEEDVTAEYPNGISRQLSIVSRRTVLNLIRNPMTSVAQVFLMIFFGILMGLIYYQLDLTLKGLQNRAGCFFFLIMMQVMSNLSALELFIKQRVHFMHESASGYYRVSVYFLSLVFADLIPNRVIPNIVFSFIIYFMIGFQLDAARFLFFVLTLVTTAIAASSLAFLASASVHVFSLANILVAMPYLLMMMFGGFLANTTSLLDFLGWIKWISIFRHGINALTINEMTGLTFTSNTSSPGFVPNSSYPCISKNPEYPGRIAGCITGEEYMEQQGIPHETAWDLWLNIVALALMAVGFLIMAYIQLRRIEKYK